MNGCDKEDDLEKHASQEGWEKGRNGWGLFGFMIVVATCPCEARLCVVCAIYEP